MWLASLDQRLTSRKSAVAKAETVPTTITAESTVSEPAKPAVEKAGLEASSSLSPEAVADLERARTWLADGQASRALRTLRRLGNDNPKDSTILTLWGQAAEQTKAWGEARSVAEQRARAEHSAEALLALVRLQKLTGQSERAKNTLQLLAKDFPENQEARAQLEKLDAKSKVALQSNAAEEE